MTNRQYTLSLFGIHPLSCPLYPGSLIYTIFRSLWHSLPHCDMFGLCYQRWWYVSPEIRLHRACEFLLTLSHHLKLITMFLGEALLGFSQVFYQEPPREWGIKTFSEQPWEWVEGNPSIPVKPSDGSLKVLHWGFLGDPVVKILHSWSPGAGDHGFHSWSGN